MQEKPVETQEQAQTDFERGVLLGQVMGQLDGVIKTLDRVIERMEKIEEKYGDHSGNASKRNEESERNF